MIVSHYTKKKKKKKKKKYHLTIKPIFLTVLAFI